MAHTTKKGVYKVGVLLERSGAGTMFREERSEPSAISLVLILLIQFAWMYGLLGQKKNKGYFGGMEKEYGDVHVCHPALLWAL